MIDSLAFYFPWNSPYAFSENRVLDMVELEGLEAAETEDKKPVGSNAIDKVEEWSITKQRPSNFMADNPGSTSTAPWAKIPSAATSLRPPPRQSGSNFSLNPSISSSIPKSISLPYEVPSLTKAQENTDYATNLFGVASLMMDGTERALKVSAANTQFRYAVRTATGGVMSAAKATAAAKISLMSAADLAGKFSSGLGVLGVASTTYSSLIDHNYTLGDFTKTASAVVSIACPVCGLVDFGAELITGKSISTRIAEGIDSSTGGWGLKW